VAAARKPITQSQGDVPSDQGGDAAPAKSLSQMAQEEFGTQFHGDVEQPAPPKPPEPKPAEPEDDDQADDEDLGGGEENTQVEGDDKTEAAKPADEDESEPIATVRELVEHLEADPAWFDTLKVDVKVHDKASQVPLREIIDNYERDQAAGERLEQAKAKSAQAQQELAQRQAEIDLQYEQAAKLVLMSEQQVLAEYAQTNWDQLQKEDPALWSAERVRLREKWDGIQQTRMQVRESVVQLKEKQAAEDMENRRVREQEQSQLLMQAIPKVSPDWGDPVKAPEVRNRLATYLTGQYGYSSQEIEQLLDHREVIIAEKARLWDESQGKVQLTKKRIRTVPRVMKPGARKEPAAINLDKVRAARQALSSTGDPEAAYALIKAEKARR
jgi:hypothetical protein